MFRALFSARAERELAALPHELQARIRDKLAHVSTSPFRFFERLTGREPYKLRVGDYRIIADIDGEMRVINVRRIRHRKNAYNDL